MTQKPVIILGAGATKACCGPLTDEILPAALNGEMANDNRNTLVTDREELLYLTHEFLTNCFNVPAQRPVMKEDCPSLPMVLSMIRRSMDLNQPLGPYKGEMLVKVKRAIEYAIFAVIEAALRTIPHDKYFHSDMLQPLYHNQIQPSVISLNYDVIIDNSMFALSERYADLHPPEYNVNISTDQYNSFRQNGTFGQLLKIHGSLNWMYCEKCKRLDLFVSEGLHGLQTAKALDELYYQVPFNDAYSCRGTPCRNTNCDGFVSPILITPTYFKDYENPHIRSVWEKAEQAMKEADRAVIIGYSLPTDDVEIAMLLKRGLGQLSPEKITVVEYVAGDVSSMPGTRTPLEKHPTGQRFRTLFGPKIDWQTLGFEGWLKQQKSNGGFPFESN